MKTTNETGQFRYNDAGERFKAINKIFFLGMTFLYIMFAVYLIMRGAMGSLSKTFVGANVAIVAIFILVNITKNVI